jgi:hypothetical protein
MGGSAYFKRAKKKFCFFPKKDLTSQNKKAIIGKLQIKGL